VLELGRFLVSEALGPRSNDTLSRWLLHAIAERIKLAEEEVNPSQRNDRENEAAELILRLWKHRAVAPIGIDPLARYERLFKSLSILLPESNPWQARETTRTQRVAADLYRCLTSLSVGLFLLSVDNIKGRSTEELDLLDRFLPSSEKAMLALFEQFEGLFSSAAKQDLSQQDGGLESRPSIAVLPIVRMWMSRTTEAIDALALTLNNVEANSSKSEEDNRETKKVSVAPSRRIGTAKKVSGRAPGGKTHSNVGKRRGKKP
jgi:hypothetical protein